jgi:hypothetical protein
MPVPPNVRPISDFEWQVEECIGKEEAARALNQAKDKGAAKTHIVFVGLGHDPTALTVGMAAVVPVLLVFALLPKGQPGPKLVSDNAAPHLA